MDTYRNLLSRVQQVRRRWWTQMAVKGVSIFLAFAIALLLFGIWGADLFGFRPAAVWSIRVVIAIGMGLTIGRFLVLPLRRRITDVQIAQYIEERYPHLEDRLVTAVEFGRDPRIPSGMLNLLIADTLDKTSRIDFSVFTDRKRILAYGSLGLSAFLLLLVLLNWGPAFLPYGFSELYVPWTHAAIGTPMSIDVKPGNTEVGKGADQEFRAQLIGFDSPEVKLFVQPDKPGAAWNALAMEPEKRGNGFVYLMVDIQAGARYYVEAKGVRSSTFAFKVLSIPKVDKIDLVYNFPPYTGMEPQKVENDGDISALKGTRVDFAVGLSEAVRAARLLFDDQSTMDLSRKSATAFTGTLALKKSGSYVVQLEDTAGKRRAGSKEYEIEALDDRPPKVTIVKPMRDLKATNVEEVLSQIHAEDDIGMSRLELRYSVNGTAEKSVSLYNGKPADTEVTGTHTFFLEEFGLQPGDVVSYYGKAWDNNDVTGPGSSSSDIYFIEIRPYEQIYKQSQQAGGGGGGGGQGESQDALSAQQKDIISATFKLIRDQSLMVPKEHQEDLKSLALIQSRLQGQTQSLIDRIDRRGAAQGNQDFTKLVEYLKTAIGEMQTSAVNLGAQKPNDALPAEQKSLQQLMRAESLFRDIQVSFGSSGGGGAGRGAQQKAEDLADLFELEINKLKNQYETVQRGEEQQKDQKVDEALQRLKELAQRQQQLNERNRMAGPRGSASQSSGGGGGQQQQQLAEELQQLQRQLQRLSRERSSPELNQASSQVQRAIEELKKSLDRSKQGNGQDPTAQGIRALQQMDEARRTLERGQNAGLQRGVEEAVNESQKLVEEQKKIQEGVDRLVQQKQEGRNSEAQQLSKDLSDRKSLLSDRVKGLGQTIDELAKQARKSQTETYRKLNDAAGTIRDRQLPQRILSGNQLLDSGYYEFMKGREESVRSNLEELNRQLESARGSIGQSKEAKLEDTLRKTRELADALDAAQRRLQNSDGRNPGAQQPGAPREGQQGRGQQPGQQGRGQPSGQQGQGEQSAQGRQGGDGARGENQPGAGGGGGRGRLNAGNQPFQTGGETPMAGSGPPLGGSRLGDEQMRQLRQQLSQGLTDATELRRSIDRNSTDSRNIDRVIGNLQKLNEKAYDDVQRIATLKEAIDLLHQMELNLSREYDKSNQQEKYFYAEDNEAPANYKKLVEEYYKALARIKP
jgi:hypothetical protein